MRMGGTGGVLALAAALLLAPFAVCAQTPEQDSTRLESLRTEGAGVRSPVITNAPVRDSAIPPGQPATLPPPATALPSQQVPAAAAPPVPEERVEFQNFVHLGVGRDLPLFGYNLFQDPVTTFAPVESVPVTADYVIGPGDEIYIRAWGQVDIDYRVTVDRDGRIYVPKVGSISVAGIKFANLDDRIRTAVRRVFKNFELTASLGQLRSIQIFVVGYAKRPGTYTVSSLSTLVNALFVSGGPSNRGSMRSIQLKRDGKVITEFDVYDLLLNGDTSKDARLLPGDVIFIPPVGARAAIAGSVHAPAIYETRSGATVGELVSMAGGLTPTAAGQKFTLERIVERRMRVVGELPLDDAGMKYTLADGDLVTVYTLSPRITNAVTLKGNVAQTMRFPWKRDMRVSDVIPERDSLIVPDYWLSRNRQGQTESWLRDAGDDQSGVGQSGVGQRGVGQRGVGQSAVSQDAKDRASLARTDAPLTAERLRTEVKRASNEINWDYAVIERLNAHDLTVTLIPFNLGKAVVERTSDQNVELMPGDVISVFSKDDIQVPIAKQSRYVRLEGELNAAGVYQIEPGQTLRQLVEKAGGVTGSAYLFGAEFTRESTRAQQQQQLNDAINRLEAEAQRVALARSQAVIAPEDAQALSAQALAQNALVARLRLIRATGRIVLDIKPKAVGPEAFPDIVLEDGDRLFIPPVPSTVTVLGAVYNPNAFVHKAGGRVSEYLTRAGGPTRDADKGSIYLLRADGSVTSKRQSGTFGGGFEGQTLTPGDAVIVPESFERFNWTKALKDWTQILYQLALGVAGLAVLDDIGD
jgi:protein involved in polysaccharide export with SLBB domain